MGPERSYDTQKIDEAAIALLLLGLHQHGRVWKTFDWNVMNRLHEQGLISDPVGKAKSVILTDEGKARAEAAFDRLFAAG